MRRILPSITTHGHTESTWRDKVYEIAPLGLKEVALFLTGLTYQERVDCYELLEAAQRHHLFSIPFVHAVSSMKEDEYRYLIHTFGVEYFNLHPLRDYPLEGALSGALRKKILIENSNFQLPLSAKDLEGFAGLCLDVSHLEDARRNSYQMYEQLISLTDSFIVGANHISAVKQFPISKTGCFQHYSTHVATGGDDLSYLLTLAPQSFSNLCTIELENSLTEQFTLIPLIRNAIAPVEIYGGQQIAA